MDRLFELIHTNLFELEIFYFNNILLFLLNNSSLISFAHSPGKPCPAFSSLISRQPSVYQ
jgi:hypothetical protein